MRKIKKTIENMIIRRKCLSGVTVIEMVLILVILIALLLIFVYLLVGISESIYPSAVVNPSLFLLLPLLESVK